MKLSFTSEEKAAEYVAKGLWKNKTFYRRFCEAADRLPDKVALIESNARYTYRQIQSFANTIAGNLYQSGVKCNDIVAVQLPNSAYMPILHLALNRIGAVYLPLHDGWREAELVHLLGKSRARTIIVKNSFRDFNYPAMLAQIKSDLPALERVYSMGGSSHGSLPFEELLKPSPIDEATLSRLAPDVNARSAIMPSSGTTSLPKMSAFSDNNLCALLDYFIEVIDLREEDISAAIAPAGTGATGYVFPILSLLLTGGTATILERWGDPKQALDLIVKNRCTYATAIPTQMTMMVEHLNDYRSEDFASFTRFNNAGAPLPYATGQLIEERMGCKVQVVYGATDGGIPAMTSVHDSQNKRLGTVGQLLHDCDVQLWDANGRQVPEGSVGEIVWSTPMKSYGYINDDEENARTWSNNYYKSGDLGQIDKEGYLCIVGRVKDMILRGGRNITPRNVEELLIKHPAIRQVAVVAMPDPRLGERACAFVQLKDGQSLDFDAMIVFLSEHKIAKWELPERLEFISEWPMSGGGKIQKNRLTEMVTKKLRAEGVLSA